MFADNKRVKFFHCRTTAQLIHISLLRFDNHVAIHNFILFCTYFTPIYMFQHIMYLLMIIVLYVKINCLYIKAWNHFVYYCAIIPLSMTVMNFIRKLLDTYGSSKYYCSNFTLKHHVKYTIACEKKYIYLCIFQLVSW